MDSNTNIYKYPKLAFRNVVFDDCEFILKLKELIN